MDTTDEYKLFVLNPNSPMKFCIFQGNMLKIKCNKISKLIQENGGIVVDYDKRDQETIVLSEQNTKPPDPYYFDIKYVKHCIKNQETLNLEYYCINKNLSTETECITKHIDSLEEFKNRCEHRKCRTAEEYLQLIEEKMS